MTALIEPHYIPSLEYFCAILPYDEIVLEGYEHFVKQTYRNRCRVNTAHGIKILTVPLINRKGKILTKDVKIQTGKEWRNVHWRTIESAYRKAPFFDHYSDELKKILFIGHEYLIDLNRDLLSFCLRQMEIQKIISASVSYKKERQENTSDVRNVIIDKKTFDTRNHYRVHAYYQVFGNEFVPDLSFIDLLFCEGPGTREVIKHSVAR